MPGNSYTLLDSTKKLPSKVRKLFELHKNSPENEWESTLKQHFPYRYERLNKTVDSPNWKIEFTKAYYENFKDVKPSELRSRFREAWAGDAAAINELSDTSMFMLLYTKDLNGKRLIEHLSPDTHQSILDTLFKKSVDDYNTESPSVDDTILNIGTMNGKINKNETTRFYYEKHGQLQSIQKLKKDGFGLSYLDLVILCHQQDLLKDAVNQASTHPYTLFKAALSAAVVGYQDALDLIYKEAVEPEFFVSPDQVHTHKHGDLTLLEWAAITGQTNVVNNILTTNPDKIIDLFNPKGDATRNISKAQSDVIISAIKHLNLTPVEFPEKLKDTNHCPLLVTAAGSNWTNIISFLLKSNDSLLEQPIPDEITALLTAAYWGHCPSTELLLAYGAKLRPSITTKETALHFALHRSKALAKLIISIDKSLLDKPDHEGRTPILNALLRCNAKWRAVSFVVIEGRSFAP